MPEPHRFAFDPDTVAAAVRQPPLENLQRRAQSRRRQRTAGFGLLAAATLTVTLTVPLTTHGSNPAAVAPVVQNPLGDLFFLKPDTAVGVNITRCAVKFTVTTDAGRTWSPLRGPENPKPCRSPEGNPVGRYQILDAHTYLTTTGDQSYVSRDAGLTWQPADSSTTTVEHFPPDATIADCGSGFAFCSGNALYATNPDTGAIYRRPPTGPTGTTIVSYLAAGGTLWTLLMSNTGHESVGRSLDGGTTWQTNPLPANIKIEAITATNPEQAYLFYKPAPGAPDADRPHIISTTDSGRTWRDTTTDLPPSNSKLRPFTATTAGTLLYADPDLPAAWTSNDNGTHFTKTPIQRTNDGTLMARGASGLLWTWTSGTTALVSTDAEHWTEIPLPT